MNFAAKFFAITLAVVFSSTSITAPVLRGDDSSSYSIAIKDFAFTPRTLTIHAGSKVTWTNKDEEPHKVVEVNSAFTSQPLDTDGDFTFLFDTPGTYKYFCSLHPHMTGTIVVEK